MKPTLIAYSTTDGQTLRICQRLQAILQQQQLPVQVMPMDAAQKTDLSTWGVLVIGASIRYGRHQKEVYRFIARHGELLQSHPNLFFSVNVVARKPEKATAQTNPYVRRFLREIAWRPQRVAVLAGRIDYPCYGWIDRQAIRLIMSLTGGPTDVRSCTEFTDWSRVDALGREIADLQLAGLSEQETAQALASVADDAATACQPLPQ